MAEETFDVVLIKTEIPAERLQQVKQEFARLTGLDRDQVDKLLSRKTAVLRKAVDRATADTYVAKLRAIGLKVELREHRGTAVKPAAATAVQPAAAPGAAAAGTTAGADSESLFEFTGTGTGYFNIWIVNTFLTMLTLGIYSAWATVRTRQYFYANTRMQDAAFEYLADPVVILKGRLVAVAALIFVIIIAALLGPLGDLLYLLLFLLVPSLLIRSLSFKFRYSDYRNIRFSFSATLLHAWQVFIFWPLAAIFTLGILLPVAAQRQAAFIITNSRFGTTRFGFTAGIRDYYLIFGRCLGWSLLIVLAAAVFGQLQLEALVVLVCVPAAIFLYYYFTVSLINIFYSSLTLDEHRFRCFFHSGSWAWLKISNMLAIIVTFGLLLPWAKVRVAAYRASHTAMLVAGDLDSFLAREQEHVSALGDELADAFDVELEF